MKTILPTVSRMATIAIIAILTMFLVPNKARANDYLEQKKTLQYLRFRYETKRDNFQVRETGNGTSTRQISTLIDKIV